MRKNTKKCRFQLALLWLTVVTCTKLLGESLQFFNHLIKFKMYHIQMVPRSEIVRSRSLVSTSRLTIHFCKHLGFNYLKICTVHMLASRPKPIEMGDNRFRIRYILHIYLAKYFTLIVHQQQNISPSRMNFDTQQLFQV